jgi:putative phosphoribosyl transferase
VVERWPSKPDVAGSNPVSRSISVTVDAGQLTVDLTIPARSVGIVLFAHGSGSSRLSPRNRFVAQQLNARGLATLLIDLLTPDEEAVDEYTRELRFDIGLLADRLAVCADWLAGDEQAAQLALGLFGASTGAAAALICAARQPDRVKAVVSRGGRPDLAGDALSLVRAPTLLIVGGRDDVVLDLNRGAQARITTETKLEILPGSTHQFEERGALERVAALAGEWLVTRLSPG